MLITLDSDDNLYIPVNNLVSRTIESSKCKRSKSRQGQLSAKSFIAHCNDFDIPI